MITSVIICGVVENAVEKVVITMDILGEFIRRVLDAPAADVVRLALPMEEVDLENLDLTLLQEYERKRDGSVRVRLVDRAGFVAELIRAGWRDPAQESAALDDFLQALGPLTPGEYEQMFED